MWVIDLANWRIIAQYMAIMVNGKELSFVDAKAHSDSGGTYRIYQFVMSFLVLTVKRNTGIVAVPGHQHAAVAGLPYTALSLVAGWWGFPWGFIYTPEVIYKNSKGGLDVTALVLQKLAPPIAGPPPISNYPR